MPDVFTKAGRSEGGASDAEWRLSAGGRCDFIARMKLPNGERASINMVKLRGYSLSTAHPEGKHKARVFAAALGLGLEQADWLRDQLLTRIFHTH